jgi:hypothetical protein
VATAAAAAQPVADALLAAAEEACRDAAWHGGAAAVLAEAQMALRRGHPPFWTGLLAAAGDLHDASAEDLAAIASAAAALRVDSADLWNRLAASADNVAFQMSAAGLLATLRALASPPASPPARPLHHPVPVLLAAAAYQLLQHSAAPSAESSDCLADAAEASRFVADMAVVVSALLQGHENGAEGYLRLTQREIAAAVLEASRSVRGAYNLQEAVKALSAMAALLAELQTGVICDAPNNGSERSLVFLSMLSFALMVSLGRAA